jgi:hypothetical protein
MTFEELTKNRSDWVKANQKNGFEKGLESLLTNMYPGKAHFIYELLQNSEDAKATKVRFKLTENALGYEHDGPKLFTFSDIDSITGIGNSTKVEDHTKIGKFGVGFKAVYAYTDSPEVHSGGYNFKIENLVIPITEGITVIPDKTKTLFKFDFDSAKKSPTQAVKEIGVGLHSLNDYTLLFLKNINRIEYGFSAAALQLLQENYGEALYGSKTGSIEIEQMGDYHFAIRSTNTTGKIRISHWLKFEDTVLITTEAEGKPISCPIAVAYALDQDNSGTWSIVPCYPGNVFVYFPAEKENSNLWFHIHAPFASTIGRDSLQDCNDNELLRDAIANLIVKTLPIIRDMNLLNMNFLSTLPNSYHHLTLFYQPILNAIQTAFHTQELTPCKDGCYGKARNLIRGSAKISECFDNTDLKFLYKNDQDLKWVANAPLNSSDEARFLQDLHIQEFGIREFLSSIKCQNFTNTTVELVEKLIETKSDEWLMHFYMLLSDFSDPAEVQEALGTNAIIRVVNQNFEICHVQPAKAFLPPDNTSIANSEILFVKNELREGLTSNQKVTLDTFYSIIGVKTYSSRTLLEMEMENSDNYRLLERHYLLIKKCMDYLKKNPDDLELFTSKKFLLCDPRSGIPMSRVESNDLCIDEPYMQTGLASLSMINNVNLLYNGYYYSDILAKKDFLDFVKKIGVKTNLEVIATKHFSESVRYELQKSALDRRDTKNTIREDFTIAYLLRYLTDALSLDTSKLIWEALLQAPREASLARYSPNPNHLVKTCKSTLVQILTKVKWLPDCEGNFFSPENISPSNLHKDFKINYSNDLLKEIGFGREEEKKTQEYKKKNDLAKAIGFTSFEEAEDFSNLAKQIEEKGASCKEILSSALHNLNVKNPIPAFPEDSIKDMKRRSSKISERISESPVKTFERKTRLINTSRSLIDSKTWLQNHYTNSEGILVCQICKKEMPFKKSNGEYYFETVEIFTKEILSNEFEQAHLALCPICSAKYQEYVKQDQKAMETLEKKLLESETDKLDIPINLDKETEDAAIHFVETHLFDLRAFLQKQTIDSSELEEEIG